MAYCAHSSCLTPTHRVSFGANFRLSRSQKSMGRPTMFIIGLGNLYPSAENLKVYCTAKYIKIKSCIINQMGPFTTSIRQGVWRCLTGRKRWTRTYFCWWREPYLRVSSTLWYCTWIREQYLTRTWYSNAKLISVEAPWTIKKAGSPWYCYIVLDWHI